MGPANWNSMGRRQNQTAESLYAAIKKGDHQQVRKLVAIDNPDLNPMKNESICSRAVHEALVKATALYSQYKLQDYEARKLTTLELSKFPAILQELLENGGADHAARYRFANSDTILHQLARNAHTNLHEVLAVLANLPLTMLSQLILTINSIGESFIHRPFQYNDFRQVFKPLLSKALQPLITICNVQDSLGNIPLHFHQHDWSIFNFLLNHTQNPFTLNHKKRTPLHTLVIGFNRWEVDLEDRLHRIRLLLRSGDIQGMKNIRDTEGRDTEGRTLLHLCSDLQMLRLLTKPEYGFLAMIDTRDEEGRTPLVLVVSRGRGRESYGDELNPFWPSMWFVAEHFISCGADVSINDRFGRSALHWLLDAVDECIGEYREEFHKETVHTYMAIQALRDCRMARRLTTILLTKGVGVDNQDVDGSCAKALAEDYWHRWEKSGMFKPSNWIISQVPKLCAFISPGPFASEDWYEMELRIEYSEATSPELARLRSELRGSGLDRNSPPVEWAEVIGRIVKGDLETLVNAIMNKSTRKRKRGSASLLVSEVSGTSEFALEFGNNDLM